MAAPDCFLNRIRIQHAPLGGTGISWKLNQNFFAQVNPKPPFHFFIDFGRSGTDTWKPLNDSPVVDDCFFVDLERRNFSKLIDHYYRIRLVLPNSPDCPVFISPPCQANGDFERVRDFLLAREIVRKEHLLQRKRTGTKGIFIKRKRFGLKCQNPDCLDYDTSEITNSDCPICFGTAKQGGYFAGIEMYVTLQQGWDRRFKQTDQLNIVNNINRFGRIIPFPYPETGDLWIRDDTGERFFVQTIRQVAEVAGIPVVSVVELRLAPTTDIVYKVPIEGTELSSASSVSSGSGDPESCDEKKGLTVSAWQGEI
jgi:hypothetical protein